MKKLLQHLALCQWEYSGATINGSKIFVVNYDVEKRLRFWNNDSSGFIDCDNVCAEIETELRDNGFNSDEASVLDGSTVVYYEIFDDDLF